MKKTNRLIRLGALSSLLTPAALPAAASRDALPQAGGMNVLLITVDDLKPLIGAYGNPYIHTPNMDRLAARGVVFRNNHCQLALCSPSRYSLLTGLRPDTLQAANLQAHLRDRLPDAVTLPQFFKNNGYTSAGVGKIFHGAEHDDPLSWSIPWTYGSTKSQYCNPDTLLEQQRLREAGNPYSTWGLIYSTECEDVPDNAYPDSETLENQIVRLRELAAMNKPFFFGAGFFKPHLPFCAPKKYWDLYDRGQFALPRQTGKPGGAPDLAVHPSAELRAYRDIPDEGPIPEDKQRELIHGYYACVSYVDALIGRLLDEVDALGLTSNTVIVLWGDHGFHLGDHGLWTKLTTLEQATRSPLIISHPGMRYAGETCDRLTEFVDVYPTLCELAGFPPPAELEGDSLVPLMKNPQREWKKAAFSQYPRTLKDYNFDLSGNAMGYSLRTERYRYTEWVYHPDWNWDDRRSWRWSLDMPGCRVLACELYDYQTDPQETRSLADDPSYAGVLKEMQTIMAGGWQAARPQPATSDR
jgi:arylsulfatase A-like enzyme